MKKEKSKVPIFWRVQMIAPVVILILAFSLLGLIVLRNIAVPEEDNSDIISDVAILFNKTFSDTELIEYANSNFNKEEMMFKDIIIGYHNNLPIRVTFPCADLCPDYTIRIIRYDINISECSKLGADVKTVRIPHGIGVVPEEFCFPKIIANIQKLDFIPVSP